MNSNLEEKKEHVFNWKIEDFCLCSKKKGEYFESPVFRAKSLYDTSWYLSLCPRTDEDEDLVACCLHRCDSGDFEIECEYEISVISPEGKVLDSEKKCNLFQNNDSCGWEYFSEKFIQLIDEYDDLLIRCVLKSKARKNYSRSENLGVTSFDSDTCSFKWIVKNLNSNCSDVTKLPFNGTSQIEISIEAPSDAIRIVIRRAEGVTEPKSVRSRITLLDVKGKKHDSRRAMHLFERIDSSVENNFWVFPSFLSKSKLNSEKDNFLKQDSFTLKCEIAISSGTQVGSVEEKECDSSTVELPTPDTDAITVLEDMKILYKDKIHTDVKLLVGGQVIKAHKSILCLRSPVFSAMFATDMAETETGSVSISDFEVKIVNSLLEYMYTGTVKKLDFTSAVKLIVAADKYQVLLLKEKCADFLKSVLSHANVCKVLVVADLVHHEVLKSSAVSYIKEHSEHIFFSEEWNRLLEKNLQLATETVSKVSKLIGASQKKTESE